MEVRFRLTLVTKIRVSLRFQVQGEFRKPVHSRNGYMSLG